MEYEWNITLPIINDLIKEYKSTEDMEAVKKVKELTANFLTSCIKKENELKNALQSNKSFQKRS